MKRIHLIAAALCLLFGFFATLPATALPPQCIVRCSCAARCSTICADGLVVTNCGDWNGECIGHCGDAAAATASTDLPDFLAPAACGDAAPAAPATPAVPTAN